MMKKLLFIPLLCCYCLIVSAQDQPIVLSDTSILELEEDADIFEEQSDLNPQRAAILSAILPGLGQIYNRQYWKVPIVWGGMLSFAHFIGYNNKLYHGLRNAALLESKGLTNPYASIVSSQTALIRNRDVFRRNRDLLIIVGSAFYLLQVVDAHVSAHLDEFRINDKLALGIEPSIQPTPLFSQAVGLSFVLKF